MLRIITIHKVVDDIKKKYKNSGIIISVNKLELLISKYKNYNIVLLDEILNNSLKSSLIKPFLSVTFDDGFLYQYKYAFPLLEKYNIKGTFFIVTKCIIDECFVRPIDLFYYLAESHYGKKIKIDLLGKEIVLELNTKEDKINEIKKLLKYSSLEIANRIIESIAYALNIKLTNSFLRDTNKQLYMQREHIKELVFAGHKIGNHSHTHQNFSSLSKNALWAEISQSKDTIKSITSVEKQIFAYPYGGIKSYSNFTHNFIKQHGFLCCCTNTGFSNDNTNFLLHRTDINTLNLDKNQT